MKRSILLALLCAALLAGAICRAEGVDLDAMVWMNAEYMFERYFHAAPDCRLAEEDAAQYERVFAEVAGRSPCPVCWADETAYSGVETWERGGTLVIRVPDHYIEERMFGASVPATVPEALLRENVNRLDDMARLVHGEAYVRWLEGAVPGAKQQLTALIPDLDAEKTDALLMSRRHLGAAWYLVVRPNATTREAAAAEGRCDLPVIFYSADLRVASYDAGSTIEQGDGSRRWTGTLDLRPKKSGGEIVFQREDGAMAEWPYVVRDGDINTAVFRMAHDEDRTMRANLQYCNQWTRLEGYVDGKSVLYICVFTDGEVQALREKYGVNLHSEGLDGGPADAAQLAADYQPVSRVTLPDGGEAAMDQVEYPVGTGFVSVTLTRPAGGIAYYANEVELEAMRDGHWTGIAAYIEAYADGDPERAHAGYFCDHVTLTVPLARVGALEEGLYQLRIEGRDSGDNSWDRWLEFRVTADAPAPTPPEKRTFGGEGLIVMPHTPPHADAATYNSCTDTTRAYEGGHRTTLLAGDMVFDLRGVDESWGWGVRSAYNLFAYPEGHPEQARQILANFDHSEVTLYDTGDGLLLWSTDDSLYRCDYDGGNLSQLGGSKGLGTSYVWDLLPVGGGVYTISSTVEGVWYAPLSDFQPRQVYKSTAGLLNGIHGGGYAVYAEGKLILADKTGILALDTTRFNPDGTLPADWLTDEYDRDSGEDGFGYIVLNGRLYYWSEKEAAMMSVKLDGTDRQVVSKERYWFNSVTPGGVVLALSGTQPGFMGDDRTDAAFFFPLDPENPTFDPDHCQKRTIEANTYDYVLGDYVYHRDADGNETWQPLSRLTPD